MLVKCLMASLFSEVSGLRSLRRMGSHKARNCHALDDEDRTGVQASRASELTHGALLYIRASTEMLMSIKKVMTRFTLGGCGLVDRRLPKAAGITQSASILSGGLAQDDAPCGAP